MTVNIVMIAKNRPRLTKQAVGSIYKHTDGDTFNLTIIDDGSDPQLLSYTFPGHDSVQVRIEDSKGIVGLVRNIGADFAERYWGRGDYICWLDNDVCLHEGWLEKMVMCMNIPDVKVLGGARHPFHGTNARLGFNDRYFGVALVDAVAGYSMLMSWETWDKYGPFDQHAKGVCQSEDFALCQKVIKDGYKVGYVSPPVLTVCGLTNTLGEKVPGYEELKKMVPEGVYAE